MKAAFTQPWSHGVVEGNVNRLKMIKRAMVWPGGPGPAAGESAPAGLTGTCGKTAFPQGKASWFPGLKARNRPQTITFAEESTLRWNAHLVCRVTRCNGLTGAGVVEPGSCARSR